MRSALLLAALLPALPACELLVGIHDKIYVAPEEGGVDLPPEAGLVLPDVGAPSEAAALETSAAMPEASVAEAATTVPDAGAAWGSGGCASVPSFVFCADFDESTEVQSGWDWTNDMLDGGTLALTTNAPVSAPYALGVVAPGGSAQNAFGKSLPRMGSYALDLDLRLDAPLTTASEQVIVVQFIAAELSLNVTLGPGVARGVTVYGGGTSATDLTLTPLATGVWTHTHIAVSASGLAVQDNGAVSGTGTLPAPNDGGAAGLLIVGTVYAGHGDQVAYSIDNVVVSAD